MTLAASGGLKRITVVMWSYLWIRGTMQLAPYFASPLFQAEWKQPKVLKASEEKLVTDTFRTI
jgi:hypothetical protein